jgi:hypothetical protein
MKWFAYAIALFSLIVLLAIILIATAGQRREGFEPVSTCARDPYELNNKTYWRESDVSMCDKGDTCQVQRDNEDRIEFAICVSPNIYHGAI